MLKDEVDVPILCEPYPEQLHDVGMVELSEERHFPDDLRRNALAQPDHRDLLHGHEGARVDVEAPEHPPVAALRRHIQYLHVHLRRTGALPTSARTHAALGQPRQPDTSNTMW